ncbi:MAG: hypothetical protein ACI4TR_06680 [Bacteroidaceae bacterium]
MGEALGRLLISVIVLMVILGFVVLWFIVNPEGYRITFKMKIWLVNQRNVDKKLTFRWFTNQKGIIFLFVLSANVIWRVVW